MELTINPLDYMDEYEIKEIISDCIRNAVDVELKRSKTVEGYIRYELGKAFEQILKDLFNENNKSYKEFLDEQVKKTINDDISYYKIFNNPSPRNIYDHIGVGTELLTEVVNENKDVLEDRIKSLFSNLDYDKDYIRDSVNECCYNLVNEKLFGQSDKLKDDIKRIDGILDKNDIYWGELWL